MVICKGITKKGKPCKKVVRKGEYCYRHASQAETTVSVSKRAPSGCAVECCICLEVLGESPLPCGHEIHRDCVQRAADAQQDIRDHSDHPPIYKCLCPVCRAPIPGMKPRPPRPRQRQEVVYYTQRVTEHDFLEIVNSLRDEHLLIFMQEMHAEQ